MIQAVAEARFSTINRFAVEPSRSATVSRAAALLEVLGVFVAGRLVTLLLIRLFNLRPVNPLSTFTADITDAQLVTATSQVLFLLVLQYGGWFLLVIPIGWWRRQRRPGVYGLTRAGRPMKTLLLVGLATAAICTLPLLILELTNAIRPLGATVRWRQGLFDTSWRRWEFWLLTGVVSWAVVPVIEELFFRGYCQRRLAEAWGDGPAIIGITCLFVLAHSQYLTLNAYNVAMIPSLALSVLGSSIVFAWTRSLIPSIITHAIGNVPMTPTWQAVMVVVLTIGAAVTTRRAAKIVKLVFSGATLRVCLLLGAIGGTYEILSQRVQWLPFVAVAMLAVSVGLEVMNRGTRSQIQ